VLSRRPNGRLRRTLVPLTVVACLSLTACQDDSEPAAAPLSSPTSSSPSGSSPTTPTEAASGSPSTSPTLDAAAEAFLDRMRRGMGKQGSAHLEMTVGGRAASTSEGDMRYGPRGSEIRLTTRTPRLGRGALEMVVLRDAAYLSIPGLTPAGKFIRIGKDNPRFKELAGASLQLSPDQSVKAFRAGLISVEERGRETVQGVPTTRYDVTADSVRALQAQGGDVVPGMPETLTYRVWLDGQDRMRRLGLAIQGVRLTMEMSRWNEPVDITAPPRSALVKAPPGF
jgi:hypothetical protein